MLLTYSYKDKYQLGTNLIHSKSKFKNITTFARGDKEVIIKFTWQ